MLWRDIEANREPALGVQALERAHEPFGRGRDRAADGGVGACSGGACLRQVVLDLPPHPLDLLLDRRRELGLPRLPRPLGLLREDRERRLEAVREIPRLRARSRHALLALGEQRVQVLDERLDLRRILAFDPRRPAVAQCRHARAQPSERGHPHPYGGERGDQKPDRQETHQVVMDDAPREPLADEVQDDDVDEGHEAHGPKHGARQQAQAERPHSPTSMR